MIAEDEMRVDHTETTTKAVQTVEIEVGNLDGPITAAHLDRAAIDVQVSTAKRYPRSIDLCLKMAESLALEDEKTADSLWYNLPRGGKDITGPSARLAEIMAYSWGNFRAESDIVDIGEKYVTAMAIAYDLERNVAVRVRVKRRITDKKGVRFNDDMIVVTCNAAMSIAHRNAVFKVIPTSYVNRIMEKAQDLVAGKTKGSMKVKRSGVVSWFGEKGVKPEQVYKLLNVEGLDDIGVKEIIRLKGIATAIEDGDSSIQEIFGREVVSPKTSDLNDALS